MLKHLPAIITLFLSLTTVNSSIAKCSINTLRKVCDVCEEKAVSKLKTDSACPTCAKCPSPSVTCIKLNSFSPFLKNSYSLALKTRDGEIEINFNLIIRKEESEPTSFSYDIRDRSYNPLVYESTGFLFYDLVNFNLPLSDGEKLYSYNCLGAIDNTSEIKGVCTTIANNESGEASAFGYLFSGVPNF